MSQTRADLDAAIAALKTKANDVNVLAQETQGAAVGVQNRVAALPPANDDFQQEVNEIGLISDSLDATSTVLANTKGVLNNILPPP